MLPRTQAPPGTPGPGPADAYKCENPKRPETHDGSEEEGPGQEVGPAFTLLVRMVRLIRLKYCKDTGESWQEEDVQAQRAPDGSAGYCPHSGDLQQYGCFDNGPGR